MTPSIKKLDHLVITTAVPEQCVEFYQKLGFTVRTAPGRLELLAADFKINVHTLGAELSPHAGVVTPGSADLCFAAAGDPEQVKAALEDAGLSIELGVVPRTGVDGPMRSLYLRDPDNNLVELCFY